MDRTQELQPTGRLNINELFLNLKADPHIPLSDKIATFRERWPTVLEELGNTTVTVGVKLSELPDDVKMDMAGETFTFPYRSSEWTSSGSVFYFPIKLAKKVKEEGSFVQKTLEVKEGSSGKGILSIPKELIKGRKKDLEIPLNAVNSIMPQNSSPM